MYNNNINRPITSRTPYTMSWPYFSQMFIRETTVQSFTSMRNEDEKNTDCYRRVGHKNRNIEQYTTDKYDFFIIPKL